MFEEARVPPSEIEAEKICIGTALLVPQDCEKLVTQLQPEHFWKAEHEAIWRLLTAMVGEGAPVEPASLAMRAQSEGKLQDIGGVERLAELCEFGSSTPDHFASIVRDRWLARQVLEVSRDITRRCYEAQGDASELVSDLCDKVIALQTDGVRSESVSLTESLRETLKNIKERGEAPAGVMTGFADLDDHLGGLRSGQLIVLAARPAVGKSALALNIATNIAKQGGGVLFVSMEMTHAEQTERVLSAESQIDGRQLLNAELTDEQRGTLQESARRLNGLNLHYLDSAFDSDSIIANIRSVHRKHGLSLVVCDYLQLCEVNGVPEQHRERAVAKLSRTFKQIAQQLQIPVLALSQLNRDVEKRTSKRPVLSDLRESGAIEQDANVVLFLHRPDMYDAEQRPGEAEVIIGKNRNGADGIVRLKFVKEHTRFELAPIYDGGL